MVGSASSFKKNSLIYLRLISRAGPPALKGKFAVHYTFQVYLEKELNSDKHIAWYNNRGSAVENIAKIVVINILTVQLYLVMVFMIFHSGLGNILADIGLYPSFSFDEWVVIVSILIIHGIPLALYFIRKEWTKTSLQVIHYLGIAGLLFLFGLTISLGIIYKTLPDLRILFCLYILTIFFHTTVLVLCFKKH